tara:strand:+ start:919 stop:1560 length:642 start_codon:yes stop_codon:yes gene_type:complete
MAKLYYGNGKCTIEDSPSVVGVEIRYRGAIEIEDNTSNSFAITQQKNGIMIFPVGVGFLNELFSYVGEFKILSVIVADNNGEKVPTTIHKVMDYSELLNSTAESMTTKSEDLSATHVHSKKVSKTTLNQPNLNNQHTSENDVKLYLGDGTLYNGYFHIHLSDNATMTGEEHTKNSQILYFSHGKSTRNPKLIPYKIKLIEKGRKQIIRNRRKR